METSHLFILLEERYDNGHAQIKILFPAGKGVGGGGGNEEPFFGGRGVSEAFQIHYSVTLTCDSKKLIFMGTSRSAHVVFIQ